MAEASVARAFSRSPSANLEPTLSAGPARATRTRNATHNTHLPARSSSLLASAWKRGRERDREEQEEEGEGRKRESRGPR